MAQAFSATGLLDVEVPAIEMPMRFAGFDDYWSPFLGGEGPAPAHAMALDATTRERLREWLRARLPAQPDGAIVPLARAWAARGHVLERVLRRE
jgi:hypothetical protein